MADTWTSVHYTLTWMLFINGSAAVSTGSAALSTSLDLSLSSSPPLPSSSPLATTSISSTSFSPALLTSATPTSDSSSPFSSISISSPANIVGIPTTVPSSLPVESSLTGGPVFNPPPIPIPISSPPSTSILPSTFSLSTSASHSTSDTQPSLSINSVISSAMLSTGSLPNSNVLPPSSTSSILPIMTPNTPASHATSTQSSSSQATTAATATHNAARPPSLDVSSQTLITIINPSIPLPSPTSPAGPPFSKKEAPPVLKILAIVISVVVSVVLLSIVLRQLVVRRRQRRSQQRQSLYPDASEDLFPPPIRPPTAGSAHSVATTYHSALRGAVHVVVDTSPARGRRWPAPPDRPSPTRPGAAGRRAMDPEQWGMTNLDGRGGVSDAGSSMSRGARVHTSANRGRIGRAY